MLVNAETALHRFCARILGWTAGREVSVEHAIRSIELATDHRAALVLLAAAAELPTPGGFMSQLNIDRASLETVLAYAASAARLVGHIDYGTVPSRGLLDRLDDNIDKVAHKLCELLGNPHLIEENARRRTEAENARRRAEDAAQAGARMDPDTEFRVDLLILDVFLEHAAPAAAHLVGHIKAGTAPGHVLDLLAKNVDHKAHVLGELLGNLRLIAENARRRAEDAAPAVAPMERVPDAQEDAK